MGEVPPLTKVYEEYGCEGFECLIIYTREAHPGENYPHHTSLEQKRSHAEKLRELEEVKIPILVDDLKGSVHRAYGQKSNMCYLVDRNGVVVYKSDWADAAELRGMCDSLLNLEVMESRNVPILRKGRSERMHWIPMDPVLRERVYRRSGEKAIQDYSKVMGYLPFATDVEKAAANPGGRRKSASKA